MERAFSKLVRKPHTRNPLPSETVGVRYKSEVSDVIHYADGSVETINHGHNVMLNSFLPLITDLLVNGKDRQLKYWAVGSGDASWDTEPKQEKVIITINQACASDGKIKVTLAGEVHEVTVRAGENANTVATLIKNMSFSTSQRTWDAESLDNVVTFTSQTFENLSGKHSYDDGGTGATGTVVVVEGQSEIKRRTPLPTDKGLQNEVYRKKITTNANYPEDGIHFLNEAGEISTEPTNVVEIQLTFGYNEGLKNGAETPWREFSIVGGANATDTLKTGYYMNVKTHACIVKTNKMLVERKIKFTFTNADS